MFCGWGHRRGCVCEVCLSLQQKSPRFRNRGKTILEVNPKPLEEEFMLRRPRPGERTGPQELVFNDTDFKATYPHLTDHLAGLKYDDGTPRVTSTLLVFCESGVLRVCVNDRDNQRSVFFTGETVEAALMAAESAIATNTAEWKTRGTYGGSQGKTPF